MFQGTTYVPVTSQLLHTLLDKAPRSVDKHGMHGWSVSGHHMRPWPGAPRHSLSPSSLKHNISRNEDNLLSYTFFFPRDCCMAPCLDRSSSSLSDCDHALAKVDATTWVRHAMAFGGHVTFDSIRVFKHHNEQGGLAHTYGGGKSFKRKREADHRQSAMQLLQCNHHNATLAMQYL